MKPRLTTLALALALVSATSCSEGQVVKKSAAYEVPVQSDEDREQLLAVMQEHASRFDYHVDHATDEELAAQSAVSPISFNASVWAGASDEEFIASAMSPPGTKERVWLSFNVGKDPARMAQFRASLMQEVRAAWPDTKELPILRGETIPLPQDLAVEGDKYVLKPSAAARYRSPDATGSVPAR